MRALMFMIAYLVTGLPTICEIVKKLSSLCFDLYLCDLRVII